MKMRAPMILAASLLVVLLFGLGSLRWENIRVAPRVEEGGYGGIVNWNPAEKSWDCPVRGSRFDPFGKVINGPAMSDLKPLLARAQMD